MEAFCTIITADYFPRAFALYSSIRKYNATIPLYVLVADAKPVPSGFSGLVTLNPEDLFGYSLTEEIFRKYAHLHMDNFRWSMKSVLAAYLLEKKYQKVLYADCDTYFAGDFHFLFDLLNQHSFIITPHWKTVNPLEDKQAFLSLFTSGIYWAGFFGANRAGIIVLQWWAKACHFMMMPAIAIGVHDDQRYLDIVPVIFSDAAIIRHRGVGIGAWNIDSSPRSIADGHVMIAGHFPIILLHFDDMLVRNILQGFDPLLTPLLHEYESVYNVNGYRLADFLPSVKLGTAGPVLKLKWKTRIRTRLKRLFYFLAEKI